LYPLGDILEFPGKSPQILSGTAAFKSYASHITSLVSNTSNKPVIRLLTNS
jgi:hypothetical protein